MKYLKVFSRYFLAVSLIIALTISSGCTTTQNTSDTAAQQKEAPKAEVYSRPEVKTADEAKQLLVEGNNRFVSGNVLNKDISDTRRAELAKGQHPFAVILTCSDSRVPPELLFDQGLGDIFIIRTAGNVLDQIAMGSVEYGVEHLSTPLLVVLGHSNCGAVKATVDGGDFPGSIPAIAAKIKPSVDKVKNTGATGDALYQKSEDENIKAVMAYLEETPVVKELVETNKLTILGAKYHVDSGQVEWLGAGE